jgi:glycosyltransferase involved in cell wall biosynthesis
VTFSGSPSAVDPPQLSVLMTVYNERTDFLETAIESVLAQTFGDFEFLILDDGSTSPDTLAALEQWSGHDPRIRLHHEPHRGLTPTLNVGLEKCSAPLICRHDADDWSLPDRFADQVRFLESNPGVSVVGSAVRLCQADGRRLWDHHVPERPDDILKCFPSANPFCHGAICFRAEAARAIGGYREAFVCSQDYDFLWRMCETYGGANLPQVLYCHRRNTGSITSRRATEQARARGLAQFLARQRAAGLPEQLDNAVSASSDVVPQDAVQLMMGVGDQQLLSGHYSSAIGSYLGAMRRAPHLPKAYLKTFRWLIFLLCPSMRARLFGH